MLKVLNEAINCELLEFGLEYKTPVYIYKPQSIASFIQRFAINGFGGRKDQKQLISWLWKQNTRQKVSITRYNHENYCEHIVYRKKQIFAQFKYNKAS